MVRVDSVAPGMVLLAEWDKIMVVVRLCAVEATQCVVYLLPGALTYNANIHIFYEY
jgi:hypothetical protein